MEKNKNQLRGYIIVAVLLVVFSVIAFVVPCTKNETFWIGYVFGIVAILSQLYFFYIAFTKGQDAKSKFYGFPIARIGVVYLISQMVLSLIEIIISEYMLTWVAIIVNIVLLAVVMIGTIGADMMRDEIENQDTNLKANVSNMRALQSLAASLPGLCQDTELKRTLQEIADEFKYSDPVSSEATKELESELKFMVNEIQRALVDEDVKAANGFCVRVKTSLAERNRVCRLEK